MDLPQIGQRVEAEQQEEAFLLAVREEEPLAPERRIEDIAPEHIEPIGQSTKEIVPPTVHAPAIVEEVIAEGAAHFEGELEDTHIEETPNVPEVEAALKESHEDTVVEVVAPGHTEDVQMVDAPPHGEPEVQMEPEIQGEHTASAPADQFQEGLVEDTSEDNVEPVVGSGGRGKGVAPKVPLLTRKAHHRSRKKKIHVHIKPVIARLNAHGEILCSLQSDISSIFISQSTGAKEFGAVKSELQEMRSELHSLKKLVTYLSDFVRVQLSASTPPAPTHSVPEDVGPSGPSVAESGHQGHPWKSQGHQFHVQLKILVLDHPLNLLLLQLLLPFIYLLHPPLSPSFLKQPVSFLILCMTSRMSLKKPSSAQFLLSLLTFTGLIPNLPPVLPLRKERPLQLLFSPPIKLSFLLCATFGLPYLNLFEHLNITLPTSALPKAEQAKILSTVESKTEDQWARANKSLYRKFEVARINIFPPKDHPLTLSKWFVYQHRVSWGPFIQKEIKFIRQFQMYHDYCFVNRLPEVQLGQFRGAIALLRTENPVNTPLHVDFATLKMTEIAFSPSFTFSFWNLSLSTGNNSSKIYKLSTHCYLKFNA
ncbi:hypothetical protein Taro_049549 [Colocasia esculenta]|uniref:Uncharacterized protein n=1 Tax=Colocasia esculenta TaxID=4460 RepID=A0A843XBA4_COLES|nr:hypothetical protein [Colocasia esculenta]